METYANPAVEINDIVTVNADSEEISNVDVRILRQSLTCDGTLKGAIIGRRID